MTTVNDISDILRIIREQPEWADALRAALLGKELLELPQRFAEFAEIANKRFAALESDVAELKAGQARLEETVSQMQGDVSKLQGDVSKLQGDLGNMRGAQYEIKIGKNIDSILAERLNLRGVRLLKGSLAGNNSVYLDLMDDARDNGDITTPERMDLNDTDFIVRGRSPVDQSAVFVVVEVSLTAGDNDVHRAERRAAILQRATGDTAIGAVVSANWDDSRQRLAEEHNVTVITVGERVGR